MKPLRVLHVIGGDDTGGAMAYLLPLLSAMRAQGCDAHLLCLGDGGLAEAAARRGLPHEILPMASPYDPRILPALHRLIVSGGWQVVHTHGMRANLPVRLVFPVAADRPLLFTTVHSVMALDYSDAIRAKGYATVDRASRVRVDAFCCVSADLCRRLADAGVPRSRIYLAYPGIELGGRGVTTSDSGTPSSPGRRTPAATIGTVCRLVDVKDLGLFLQTFEVLGTHIDRTRAVIAGDGPERDRLEQQARSLGLQGQVDFLGRVERISSVLSSLDVFVLTSEYEGLPISVLEAMSTGLPVVATAVGGVPEAVEEGVTGFLVERNQDRAGMATALAACVAQLLLDPRLRTRMGEAAQLRVAERFSSQAAGRRMLRAYARELAALPNRHRA